MWVGETQLQRLSDRLNNKIKENSYNNYYQMEYGTVSNAFQHTSIKSWTHKNEKV